MSRKLSREQQKKAILKKLATSDNISEACQSAKCTRAIYNEMISSGYITEAELLDARLDYGDRLLTQLNKAGLDGIKVPVISHGKVSMGADGKPLTRIEYDMTSLRLATERYLASQKQQETVTGDGVRVKYGIVYVPVDHRVLFDDRDLDQASLRTLIRVAKAIDDKKASVQSNGQNQDTMPIKGTAKRGKLPVSSNGV